MALTFTKKDKMFWNGLLIESGTWAGDGGTTTGTFTADGTSGEPEIVEIYGIGFSSNGDNAVKNHSLTRTTQTITHTANDAGRYFCIGRCG